MCKQIKQGGVIVLVWFSIVYQGDKGVLEMLEVTEALEFIHRRGPNSA